MRVNIDYLESRHKEIEQQEVDIVTSLGQCRKEKRVLKKQIEEYYDTREELKYWQDRRKDEST